MLVLIIGDMYIPVKAHELSKIFREHLQPGKIHQILCTGNVCCKSALDSLRQICTDITVVRGEFDDESISKCDQTVLTIGGFHVGLVSSFNLFPLDDHSRVALKQRELGVDILIHGGSHKADAYVYDGCFYLDPGSATGAFTASEPNPVPSFILLNVQGSTAVAYIYTLSDDGSISVRKEKFTKEDA